MQSNNNNNIITNNNININTNESMCKQEIIDSRSVGQLLQANNSIHFALTNNNNKQIALNATENKINFEKQLTDKSDDKENTINTVYLREQIWEEHCYTPHMPWIKSATTTQTTSQQPKGKSV